MSLESHDQGAPESGEHRGRAALASHALSRRAPFGEGVLGQPGPDRQRHELDGDAVALSVRSRRFAYGVRVHFPGFRPTEDAFSIEPGGERRTVLLQSDDDAVYDGGWLTAITSLDG